MATIRAYAPDDITWLVERHRAVYAQEFGWDHRFGDLVESIARELAMRADPREAGWIAEVDGTRAGCVFLAKQDDRVAKLRLLLVEPAARGHGVGGLLVETCIAAARSLGYETMTLWTTSNLAAARRLYERAGFVLVEESPTSMFGAELVSQQWSLRLASAQRDPAPTSDGTGPLTLLLHGPHTKCATPQPPADA